MLLKCRNAAIARFVCCVECEGQHAKYHTRVAEKFPSIKMIFFTEIDNIKLKGENPSVDVRMFFSGRATLVVAIIIRRLSALSVWNVLYAIRISLHTINLRQR